MPPPSSILPRELRDVKHVGQRLLAAGAQHEADVRARRAEQLVQHVRRAAPFAPVAAVGEARSCAGDGAA